MTPEINKKIVRARTQLLLNYPFFGSLTYAYPFEEKKCGTWATDGERIFFDPVHVAKEKPEQTIHSIAHEVVHCALLHCQRGKGKNPKAWNIAVDIVTNEILKFEGLTDNTAVYDSELFAKHNGVAEPIYNEVLEMAKDALSKYKPKDKHLQPEGSGALSDYQIQEMEAKAAEALARARQEAKAAGNISDRLSRFVDAMINPVVDWRSVLRQFVMRSKADRRSWARPNRRFISQGVYTPSADGESMGDMLVAVDCSGSISNKELAEFAAEITAIHQDARPAGLHVLYFDSDVAHYDRFEQDDEPVIKPHGGGGTAFSPIWKYAEAHDIEPVCCVVLTDLYCDDFGPAPDYPVLWVCNSDQFKVPFGEVIKMVRK